MKLIRDINTEWWYRVEGDNGLWEGLHKDSNVTFDF